MNRRSFVQTVAGGAVAAGGAASAGQGGGARRPNFLFFMADDLTYRSIHAWNNEEVRTPNLDRLVERGCAFTHAFHNGAWDPAVCVPSRTMLNCGLTSFRAQRQLDSVPTWGQTLGNAGYQTYIVGKWHLDATVLQRSFQEMGPVGLGMFPSTADAYDRPSPGNHWTPWDKSLKGHWIHTDLWLNRRVDEVDHTSVVWASQAVDHLLNRAAKREQPFFMYVAFNAPHDPRQSPREFVEMYPASKIEIPPNYLPEHPFDQGDHRIRDEILAPFPRTRAAVQLHRSEYYAILTHMDRQLGLVLDALERSGKADNTYVILTADHGLAVGQHGLMGKQNMYDHSIRMPLLISGPGIARGRRVDELVYQHSLFATTCELAGIPVPKTVEFPSMAGYLRGEGGAQHDAIFSYYRGFQRAIRTKTHKLIVYPQVKVTQLFDMEKDPWEMHNLAEDAGHAALRKELFAKLRQMQKEMDDPLELAG